MNMTLLVAFAISTVAPTPLPPLALKLEAPKEAIHVGDDPKFVVTIKNQSETPLRLVEPGDGSESKWRTPIIGWSVLSVDDLGKHPREIPLTFGSRCGNINPLKLKEVFTLQSERTKRFKDWIGSPEFTKPGKYRVVFYYQNIPAKEISGIPLGKHEAGVIREIEMSYPCELMSNEVIVEVYPKKTDLDVPTNSKDDHGAK